MNYEHYVRIIFLRGAFFVAARGHVQATETLQPRQLSTL